MQQKILIKPDLSRFKKKVNRLKITCVRHTVVVTRHSTFSIITMEPGIKGTNTVYREIIPYLPRINCHKLHLYCKSKDLTSQICVNKCQFIHLEFNKSVDNSLTQIYLITSANCRKLRRCKPFRNYNTDDLPTKQKEEQEGSVWVSQNSEWSSTSVFGEGSGVVGVSSSGSLTDDHFRSSLKLDPDLMSPNKDYCCSYKIFRDCRIFIRQTEDIS